MEQILVQEYYERFMRKILEELQEDHEDDDATAERCFYEFYMRNADIIKKQNTMMKILSTLLQATHQKYGDDNNQYTLSAAT